VRVAHVAAECGPWAKVGGLADVLGALPRALGQAGVEATVFLPCHQAVRRQGVGGERLGEPFDVRLGGRTWSVALERVVHPGGFPVVLLDCPSLYDRPGIYVDPETREPYPDDLSRWGVLCRGALWALQLLGGRWDILHAHDAHAAAAVAMLRSGYAHTPIEGTRAVLSLHNVGYQGLYPIQAVATLDLPLTETRAGGPLEFWGRLNLLKAGIVHADALSTVSPTYAREIVSSPDAGFGLEGVLAARRDRLVGILNGIDTETWDPATDPLLPARYDAGDLSGKASCKRALHQIAGWPDGTDLSSPPLLGVVSRLVDQKGVDLIVGALPGILASGARLVVLGSGQAEHEAALSVAARDRPDAVWVRSGFDEPLAHLIEAGADAFLMPSRYEPCGLNQMYSMRYGTVPIVRATGGLADTVPDWDRDPETGRGFCFTDPTPSALLDTVHRALRVYRGDIEAWTLLMRRGMAADFSWHRAARAYREWYEGVVGGGAASRHTVPG